MNSEEVNGTIFPNPPHYVDRFFPPSSTSPPLLPPPLPTTEFVTIFDKEIRNPHFTPSSPPPPPPPPPSTLSPTLTTLPPLISTTITRILTHYSKLISELVSPSLPSDIESNTAHASSTATIALIRLEFLALHKICDELRERQAMCRAVEVFEEEVKRRKRKSGVIQKVVEKGFEVVKEVEEEEAKRRKL